jgi:polyhydroxybutyrate depolymerase
MRPGDLAVLIGRYGTRCLPALVISLVLWLPVPGAAGKCDYTGFDQPCAVQEGVYRALIPEGEGPFPVMVYLYGSGGQSVSITSHPLFNAAVVQRGYALIVPAALDMEYRKGVRSSGWALRHEPGERRDEALFLSRVIDDVGRRFPIDRDRVLLVGQSRGAFLIWEIACHEPELAAAFAVHAGGYLGNLPEECERPVRFLHSHGLGDPIVPFAGEPVVSGGVAMATLERSLDTLARTNRCRDVEPEDAGSRLGLQRTRWTGCAPGASLDLMLHGGGHVMPVDWFRTVLDWFEEPPAAVAVVTPLTRLPGVRAPGRFKAVPSAGAASATPKPGAGRRLQAPGRSKNSSQ